MAIIFLFLQWPALPFQHQVVLIRDQKIWQADLTQTQWENLPGRPISQYAHGFIYEKDGLWLWSNGEHSQIPWPEPSQNLLVTLHSEMERPCLLSLENFWLWDKDQWIKFPAHHSASCLPPGQQGSFFGLSVQPADWVWQNGHLLAFQEKEDKIWVYFGKRKQEFERKADQLFLLNGQATWIGWGKDERLKMAEYHQGKETTRSLTVPQLDKHALRIKTQNGTWFFTFDDGMMAALDAWKTKKIEVTSHFIRNGQRISHDLGELPLDFEMGTSGSGSPKLHPQPAFQVLPVINEDDLCLTTAGETIWISPKSIQNKRKMELKENYQIAAFKKRLYLLTPEQVKEIEEYK